MAINRNPSIAKLLSLNSLCKEIKMGDYKKKFRNQETCPKPALNCSFRPPILRTTSRRAKL